MLHSARLCALHEVLKPEDSFAALVDLGLKGVLCSFHSLLGVDVFGDLEQDGIAQLLPGTLGSPILNGPVPLL